jgi:hypothetical protein
VKQWQEAVWRCACSSHSISYNARWRFLLLLTLPSFAFISLIVKWYPQPPTLSKVWGLPTEHWSKYYNGYWWIYLHALKVIGGWLYGNVGGVVYFYFHYHCQQTGSVIAVPASEPIAAPPTLLCLFLPLNILQCPLMIFIVTYVTVLCFHLVHCWMISLLHSFPNNCPSHPLRLRSEDRQQSIEANTNEDYRWIYFHALKVMRGWLHGDVGGVAHFILPLLLSTKQGPYYHYQHQLLLCLECYGKMFVSYGDTSSWGWYCQQRGWNAEKNCSKQFHALDK